MGNLVTVALGALCLVGCSRSPAPIDGAPAARTELVVYAATSLRDVLREAAADFAAAHPVDVVFNFGSSGDLSRQIVAAAKADVFVSADANEMDRVEQAGLVAPGTRRTLLSNQLVVIEPADGASLFSHPFTPAQLARPEIRRLSLGNVDTVPAGRYARAWLEASGVWDEVSGRVLPGVDVRAALAAVESGAAQAGIVYRTDVARSRAARVVYLVPPGEGPRITYPVAAVANRPAAPEAAAFLAFLAGPAARPSFEAHGFLVLPAAAPGR